MQRIKDITQNDNENDAWAFVRNKASWQTLEQVYGTNKYA